MRQQDRQLLWLSSATLAICKLTLTMGKFSFNICVLTSNKRNFTVMEHIFFLNKAHRGYYKSLIANRGIVFQRILLFEMETKGNT